MAYRTSAARTASVSTPAKAHVAFLWVLFLGFGLLTALCATTQTEPNVRMYVSFALFVVIVDQCMGWCDGSEENTSPLGMPRVGVVFKPVWTFCAKADGVGATSPQTRTTPNLPAEILFSDAVTQFNKPWKAQSSDNGHESRPLLDAVIGKESDGKLSKPRERTSKPSMSCITQHIEMRAHTEDESCASSTRGESHTTYIEPTSEIEVGTVQLKTWFSTMIFGSIQSKIAEFDAWCAKNDLTCISTDVYLHRSLNDANLQKYRELLGPNIHRCSGSEFIKKLLTTFSSTSDPNFLALKSREWLEELFRVEDTFNMDNAKLRESEWKQRRSHVKAKIELFALDKTFRDCSTLLPNLEAARTHPSDCEIVLHLLLRMLPGTKRHFRFGHQPLVATERFPGISEHFALFYAADGDCVTCFLQRVFPQGGTERQRPATTFDTHFPRNEGVYKQRIVPPSTSSGFFQALLLWLNCTQHAYEGKANNQVALEGFKRLELGKVLAQW